MANFNGLKLKVSFEGKEYYPEYMGYWGNQEDFENIQKFMVRCNEVGLILQKIKQKLVAEVPEYAYANDEYMACEKEALLFHSDYKLHDSPLNRHIPFTEEELRMEAVCLEYVAVAKKKDDAFIKALMDDLPVEGGFVQTVLAFLPEHWRRSNNCNMATFSIE